MLMFSFYRVFSILLVHTNLPYRPSGGLPDDGDQLRLELSSIVHVLQTFQSFSSNPEAYQVFPCTSG